jgi:DNA-directed RNA polymerase subunit H (RpoH/RPB5)
MYSFSKKNKMNREEKSTKVILEMFSQRLYTDIKHDTELGRVTGVKKEEVIVAFTRIIPKLNMDEIQLYISTMNEEKIKHIIIIHEGTPTPVVKGVVDNMNVLGNYIELFLADNLQYNVTKSYLVPLHCFVDKLETKNIKAAFPFLPILLRSDPICRFYDFHGGEIVRIVRKNDYICYRIVK